jgi:3'(2'), 5'-bisphosphate nucleotidase
LDNQLTYLLKKAIEASILGGQEILNIYKKEDFNIEYKDDNSPVTIADKLASKKITKTLKDTLIPILSEEEEIAPYTKRKLWNKLWIIDPLDGTKEFIKKNGEFCVNIAYTENNTPVFGVIYIPTTKELFYGGKLIGAFKIDNITEYKSISIIKPTILPTHKNKNKIVVTGSRSHGDEKTTAFYNEIKSNNKNVDFLKVGSAIKFCRVAEGKVDYYPRFHPCMEWDTAAGHAIVQGIGKEIYNANTNTPLVYNKESLFSPHFILK